MALLVVYSSMYPSQTGGSPCAAVGSTSPDMPEYSDDEVYPDCDWSEHVCPDGNKYYYNCVTYESKVMFLSLLNLELVPTFYSPNFIEPSF